MNQCKRLSDCPADRLAQCRGQAVQARCDALQGLLNKADQRIDDLTHPEPVPPAGGVEVLAWMDRDGDFYKERCYPEMKAVILLSDHRTHVTRLTAKLDGLKAEVGRLNEIRKSDIDCINEDAERREALQSELTKARELLEDSMQIITRAQHLVPDVNYSWMADAGVFINTYQCAPATPIAHNVDESSGQDAEAAKGEPCDDLANRRGF